MLILWSKGLTLIAIYWIILHAFFLSVEFFKINIFKKFFGEYRQRVKQFGFRSGLTFCRARSGSKLFAMTKVAISREKRAGQ